MNRNFINDGCDFYGRIIVVGQKVLKPKSSGRAAIIEEREVTRVEDGKIYLDSKIPINFSGRLVIIGET